MSIRKISSGIANSDQNIKNLDNLPAYTAYKFTYNDLLGIVQDTRDGNLAHREAERGLSHLNSFEHNAYRVAYHVGAGILDPINLIPLPL